MLVEDDVSVLRALRRLITSAGFDVRSFTAPGALLETNLPGDDACLLVDVHLPEMNGIELCEKLLAAGCRLPIIFMSGHLDERTRRLAERANAVDFLLKPFSRDVLVAALTKAFEVGPR